MRLLVVVILILVAMVAIGILCVLGSDGKE